MAKPDSDKDVLINGDEVTAEAAEGAGDSALLPSTSSEHNDSASLENEESQEESRGVKRSASVLSEDENESEQFQGFGEECNLDESAADMSRLIEHMENDLSTASLNLTPVRQVTVGLHEQTKRLKQDTESSRPSSALSTRSDSDGVSSNSELAHSGNYRGRKNTTEISSPLFRVPLQKGWKRELVYRAALDHHSRRLADIYYYTPQGKKLRSTREVSEHLSGTGLTLENFSFFKEPLGVDDPEKEIIRGAKLLRRNDTPVTSPAPVVIDGKRTPKPKPPKGASPEPTPKSTPLTKIKVKSFGSRLSGTPNTPSLTQTVAMKRGKSSPVPTPVITIRDNNNTSAKKARLLSSPPHPAPTAAEIARAQSLASLSSPPHPCSMSCGRARGFVPTLSCASCLCLYHPACVGFRADQDPNNFFCKNCRVTSPPTDVEVSPRSGTPPESARLNERVTLRMKMSGAGPGGSRQWSVRGAVPDPQGVAKINGRQYIVVARSGHERRTRSDRTNGSVSPLLSPGKKRPKDNKDHFIPFYKKSKLRNYNVVNQIFQYLGMRELANCARVSRLWRKLVATPMLWRNVRMKNSQVSDWAALCALLKKYGTNRLDLRKTLLPANDSEFWDQFAKHIGTVDTLERLELCRCPARAVEAACSALPGLTALSALAVRDSKLSPAALAAAPKLQELKLKSMAGLSLASDLAPLQQLSELRHLSLTSIKELGARAQNVIGRLRQLVSLELGECTFGAEFGSQLAQLTQLQRLRLERGTAACAATDILRALATLPSLTQLELVNFDVKTGFDDALSECHNIQRLLIIPTYVSQSATTNKLVLNGVLQLKETLTHLMWGVTIELLRVTELFIDQCDNIVEKKKVDIGECIPVLKPLPGCTLTIPSFAGPPQVEVVPLASLQRLLSSQLPNTKLKLLRIPFHATWRQSLADFQ